MSRARRCLPASRAFARWLSRTARPSESESSSSHKRREVVLDGGTGEGGGQILRTALSLSVACGIPFRIERIRHQRPVPGLRQQHLTCVQAAADVCNATVRGASIGSNYVEFTPGTVAPGEYEFSVGSAGSAVLVCQTLLYALMCADRKSTLVLRGGTHNPHAPTFDFLQSCLLPLLTRMGPRCEALLLRPGAGRLRVEVEPVPRSQLRFLHLTSRGRVLRKEIHSVFGGISHRYAQEQALDLSQAMRWQQAATYVDEWQSESPGMSLAAVITSENVSECFTALANTKQRQLKAPIGDLCALLTEYLADDVPVGPYLADQILLPMALGRGGEFRCTAVSDHTRTQIDTIRRFLDVDIVVERAAKGRGWFVLVNPEPMVY